MCLSRSAGRGRNQSPSVPRPVPRWSAPSSLDAPENPGRRGTLVDGQSETRSETWVRLPRGTVLGFPLAGGHVHGDYGLAGPGSRGSLNPLMSVFTAGPDNTIDLGPVAATPSD